MKIFEIHLRGIYFNSFQLLPFNHFKKNSEHKSEKHASEKCYLISSGASIFVFYIRLSCNENLFSKILFRWYGAYLICSFQFQAEDHGHLQELRLTFL